MTTFQAIAVVALYVFGFEGQAPERRKVLNDIITQRVQVTPAELQRIVREHLSDEDLRLREGALHVIAARSQAKPQTPTTAWREELAVLESFRPTVRQMLTEPARWEVRRAAVWAIANLDIAHSTANLLSKESVDSLLWRFSEDSRPEVRAESLKALAITANDDGRIALLMEQGLESPDPRVRFYAVRGVARLRPPQAFEKAFHLISDPDPGIRFGAVMAVLAYPDKARSRLPQIEAAVGAETNESMKRALQASIERLRRGR